MSKMPTGIECPVCGEQRVKRHCDRCNDYHCEVCEHRTRLKRKGLNWVAQNVVRIPLKKA